MITQSTNLGSYIEVLNSLYEDYIQPVLSGKHSEVNFSNWENPPSYFGTNTLDRCNYDTYKSLKDSNNNFVTVNDNVVFYLSEIEIFASPFNNDNLEAITKRITDILGKELDIDNLSFSNRPLHYRKYKGYNGFMGWHTNCDYPGDRWYFVYNTNEDSSFTRYIDQNTGKMITKKEPKGWSLNHFVVGNCSNPFWHCIYTNNHRFSFGLRQIVQLLHKY